MLIAIAIVVFALYILTMLFAALRMGATIEQRTLQPEPVKIVEAYRRLH